VPLASLTADEPSDAWVIRKPSGFAQVCAELGAYTFLMTPYIVGFSVYEFT